MPRPRGTHTIVGWMKSPAIINKLSRGAHKEEGGAKMVDAEQLVIKQIANRLHEMFDGQIDLSDVKKKPAAEKENFFRTRGLAALALVSELGIAAHLAAASVSDGGADDGIDAVYIDNTANVIYLVQSKWRSNVKKGIELSEFTRFRDGVKSLLSLDWTEDNKNLHRFQSDLEIALGNINTK